MSGNSTPPRNPGRKIPLPFVRGLLSKLEGSPLAKRLAHGSMWSFLGSVTSRFLALGSAMLAARIIGKAEFGELGIIQSTVSMFGTMAGFGLGTTATKFVAEFRNQDPGRAGRIIALSSLVSWVSGLILGLALFLSARWLCENTLAAPDLTPCMRISALLLFFTAINGAQTGALSGFEAFKRIAFVNSLTGLLNFPLVIGGALLYQLPGLVWGLVIAQATGCLLNFAALRYEAAARQIEIHYRSLKVELPILWRFSLPAVLSTLVMSPANWLCATMLVHQVHGYDQMGAYNAANQWFNALMWLPYMIGSVITPMLAERFGANDNSHSAKLLGASLKINAAVTLPMILIGSLFSPWIMSAYGHGFQSEWPTLIAVLVSAGIFALEIPVGSVISASGRMWIGVPMNLGWAVVFVISNMLLLPWGSLGMAVARLIAYAVHAIWNFSYALHVIRQSSNETLAKFRATSAVPYPDLSSPPPEMVCGEILSTDEDPPHSAAAKAEGRFSVIIPTFNRGHLIQRAIESALNQTVPPSQIIVIDDGSTDNTAAVCARYGNSILYVRQKNGGVAAARNHGIRLAKFPWIAFLDSDDYWTPAHLENMAAAIKATEGKAHFYFADMELPGVGQNTIWKKIGLTFSGPHLLKSEATEWLLASREPCCIQCTVFSASLLKSCGGFDTRFRVTEDRELFCRLGFGFPICAVNAVGCIQTADDNATNRLGGILHGRTEGFWKHEVMLWSSLLDRFPNMKPSCRRAIRYSLASAHWRLGRIHWLTHRRWQSLGDVMRCALAEPAFILWVLRRRSSDGWESTVVPPVHAE